MPKLFITCTISKKSHYAKKAGSKVNMSTMVISGTFNLISSGKETNFNALLFTLYGISYYHNKTL